MLNKIKIIAGKWRGRSIDFPATEGLRPTPNRIRETLFNWLAPTITDAVFLDAFGGSGALSFEALSRGAKAGTFIDSSSEAQRYCRLNRDKLAATTLTVVASQAPACFSALKPAAPYDIVFLDPPFQQSLLLPSLLALLEHGLIDSRSVVYVEVEKTLSLDTLAEGRFQVVKTSTAGAVRFGLLKPVMV